MTLNRRVPISQPDQAPPRQADYAAELSTRQVSIWLTEADADFLRVIARERNQSVSGVIRSAVATWRRQRASNREPRGPAA